MKTILFPATLAIFFSTWSIIAPFKDAECTIRSFFATATVETELGGSVSCSTAWGFPRLTVGAESIRFKLECTEDQKTRIKNFRDTLSVLNNLISPIVIQKLIIIEQIISQEKIDFKDYRESVNNYITEIEKLEPGDKKRLEKFFN